MSYNIKVEYIKGTTNIFADLLSRFRSNQELNKLVDSRERKECVVMKINKCVHANLAAKLKRYHHSPEDGCDHL